MGKKNALRLTNGLFLMIGGHLAFLFVARRKQFLNPTITVTVFSVLAASVATALVELPNARFAMPTRPLAILSVAAVAHSLVKWATQRS